MRRTRRQVVCSAAIISLAALAGCATDQAATPNATVPGSRPASVATTAPPARAWNRSLATTVEEPDDLPGYEVFRPTDLGAPGAALPVIVWANGGCVRFDGPWKPLLERWAQAGFVVVAITTPPATDPAAAGAATADDQSKAIDWALARNDDPASPFHDRLDPSRIVASGNSCGGITSLRLASQDPRVRAVFVLSGSSVGPGATRDQASAVMAKVSVPVGFAVGGPDDISRPQAQQDYDLLAPGIAGMIARRSVGDHPKVSTDPAILGEAAEISVNWLDAVVNGNAASRDALAADACAGCPAGTWTVDVKGLR